MHQVFVSLWLVSSENYFFAFAVPKIHFGQQRNLVNTNLAAPLKKFIFEIDTRYEKLHGTKESWCLFPCIVS